jgi:hypothetical protein
MVGVAVVIAAFVGAMSQRRAAEGEGRAGERDRPRLVERGPMVVKTFVAQLRKAMSDEGAGELRGFIDPRYLKEHGLEAGGLPIARVVTGAIYDNRLSADPRTIVIVAETADSAKEAFVFRTSVYEGNVHILPLSPPDAAGGRFEPWILRMKV